MIETKEKMINGSKYAVTQMTARRALRMKSKLIKIFGSSLAQIYLPKTEGKDSSKKGGNEKRLEYNKEDAVQALKNLSHELDENILENLFVELLSGVRKDGIELTEHVIDLEFAGDIGTIYLVVFFVIEVNFSSFLEMMGFSITEETP